MEKVDLSQEVEGCLGVWGVGVCFAILNREYWSKD